MADEEQEQPEEDEQALAEEGEQALAEEGAEEQKEEAPPPVVEEVWEKPKRNVILIVIVLINTVLAVWLYFRQINLNKELEKYKDEFFVIQEPRMIEDIPAPARFEMKPLYINLAEWNGPRRYLRITPYLEIEAKDIEEIEAKKDFIRDAIIKHVNKKNPEDLLADGGVDKIKRELIEVINKVLKATKVTKIYFLDYRVN